MGEQDAGGARAAAFAELFRDAFDDVRRFCARRVPPDRAEDIAAETLAIAWRRFDEVPPGRGNQRAWLFTTSRNLMLREGRDDARRRTLAVRIGPIQASDVVGADSEATVRVDLSRAWRLLSPRHQEALALAVWDGLNSSEAAAVLGVSSVAYRLRLSRARTALGAHLGIRHAGTAPTSQTRAASRRTGASEATP